MQSAPHFDMTKMLVSALVFAFFLGQSESSYAGNKTNCVRALSEFKSHYADGYMDGIDPQLVGKLETLNLSKMEINELLGANHSVEVILKNFEPLNESIETYLADNSKSMEDLSNKMDGITKQIEKANKLKHFKKVKDLEKSLQEVQWTHDQVSENSEYLVGLRAYIHSVTGVASPSVH